MSRLITSSNDSCVFLLFKTRLKREDDNGNIGRGQCLILDQNAGNGRWNIAPPPQSKCWGWKHWTWPQVPHTLVLPPETRHEQTSDEDNICLWWKWLIITDYAGFQCFSFFKTLSLPFYCLSDFRTGDLKEISNFRCHQRGNYLTASHLHKRKVQKKRKTN